MTKEMTNEEAKEVLGDVSAYLASRASLENEMLAGHTFTDICNAIKILKQQPCKDCISREAVIEWLKDKDIIKMNYQEENARRELAELPSVTPQRPKGKWIEQKVCNCYATLKCSVCDRIIEPTFTYGEYSYEDIEEWYPFCHCGADMRGEEK